MFARFGLPAAHPVRLHHPLRLERHLSDGSIVCRLIRTVEAHNPGSAGHAMRVGRLARDMARLICLSDRAVATITEAALLHDIGKLAVSASILGKPGSLTEAEREAVRVHVPAGVQLVRGIAALGRAAVLIRASHEWVNGAGYPRGLRGNAIPLGSRIIAVADAFDALTQTRVYRRPVAAGRAIEQLKSGAGIQFDPRALLALERLVKSEPAEEADTALFAGVLLRPAIA